MSRRRRHVTYVLGLWQAQTKGGMTWRAWLESPSTGERRGFATLDKLFNYLKTRAGLLDCLPDAGLEQVPPPAESEKPGSADEPPTNQSEDCQTLTFSAMRRGESKSSLTCKAQKKRRSAP